MTITTDSNGDGVGKFTIPPNIQAGAKEVIFTGDLGSSASAIFTGITEVEIEDVTVDRRVIPPTPRVVRRPRRFPNRADSVDPLAQTFTLLEARQIIGVDIWFAVAGAQPVALQIRETELGFPTRRIIDQAVILSSNILTDGSPTRFAFDSPVFLDEDIEYALVVLTEDTSCAVSVAELGKFDTNNNQWVTSQPYQVGVLLSSSNASTWTAHQDRDLTFSLIAAKYTETDKLIDLGQVAVTGATDLIALPISELPPNQLTDVTTELTLPDTSLILAGDGHAVKLTSAITGNVGVKVRLQGTTEIMPVLSPGFTLVEGILDANGVYISRVFPCGTTQKITITFDGYLPSGSTVAVDVADGDDVPTPTWTNIAQTSNQQIDENDVEYIHVLSSFTAPTVRVKIELNGTPAARPYLKNLRIIVT